MEFLMPVNGSQLWVEDTGAADEPDAVVLLHPGWGDSRIWAPLLTRLPADLRTIRYDIRAFGQSPAPTAPYTQLGDLVTVLDQLGVRRAVLVGHSGGAGPAIGLALQDPGRVSGLVLVAPGVHDYPWPQDDAYWQEVEAAFVAQDRDAVIEVGLRTWAAGSADVAALEQISSAADAYFRLGDFERPDPPAFARLHEIEVPTVVLLGDLDSPLVDGSARAIANGIAGSQLIVAEGVDHLVPLRCPDLLADLITAKRGI